MIAPPCFYDTHAHLDYPDFAADLDQVLQRAWDRGVGKIVCVGTTGQSSLRAIELAEKHEHIYAAVGWHPSHASEAPLDVRAQLKQMAEHPKVVAIGETGLDFHRLPSRTSEGNDQADEAYRQSQIRLFEQHLEVAAELGLRCVVHQRDSMEAILDLMEPRRRQVQGVFHCFVDGPEVAERILAMGSLVSFTGVVTFKNAETVRRTLGVVPLRQFMFETDCPFLAPAPHRGKRCEPANIAEITQVAAEVRKCRLEELSEATCYAAEEFFRRGSTTPLRNG